MAQLKAFPTADPAVYAIGLSPVDIVATVHLSVHPEAPRGERVVAVLTRKADGWGAASNFPRAVREAVSAWGFAVDVSDVTDPPPPPPPPPPQRLVSAREDVIAVDGKTFVLGRRSTTP